MVVGIKLFLLALAVTYFCIAIFKKDLSNEEKLHYHISSDIFLAALLLSILILSLSKIDVNISFVFDSDNSKKLSKSLKSIFIKIKIFKITYKYFLFQFFEFIITLYSLDL